MTHMYYMHTQFDVEIKAVPVFWATDEGTNLYEKHRMLQ